tara:strand:- start:114 stop:434 length:321 start_codon:yes stop_codon:yes gene_type:complete
MNKKMLFLSLLFFLSASAYAGIYEGNNVNANDDDIGPCDPSPFGTFCELRVKVKPTPKFQDYAYCGRTYVAITAKQRTVLNAYLVEQKNMIVRFKLDGEFINAPCF